MKSGYIFYKRKYCIFTLGLATCQLFTFNLLGQSVGINTDGSAPTELLHVKGGLVRVQGINDIYLNTDAWANGGGTYGVSIKSRAGGWNLGYNVHNSAGTSLGGFMIAGSGDSRTSYFIGTNADQKMSILANGNIGIGTAEPNARLKVIAGSSATEFALKLAKSSYADDGTHSTLIGLGCENASWSRSAIGHTRTGSYDRGYLGFYVSSNASSGAEMSTADLRMMIDHNGNVGIGTTTPVSKLSIAGGSANWSETTPGLGVGSIHLDPENTTDHFGNAITFGASDAGNGENAQAGIYVRSDGSYGTKMYFSTSNNYGIGATSRMMIDHNGNVGIGNATPGHKLEVTGNIKASASTMIGVSGHGASYSAFWREGSDYSLLTDGSGTYLNAPSATGVLYFRAANADRMTIDGSTGAVSMTGNLTANNISSVGSVVAPGDFFGRYNVADTRSDNLAPATYSKEIAFEFKDRSVLGAGGSGSYGGLMTIAPWGDGSGNKNHQLYFNDGGIFYRTGAHGSSWDSWQQIISSSTATGGDMSGTFGDMQIAANVVGNSEIADNAVNTAEITDNAVTSAKIANGTIVAEDLSQMGATTNQVLLWNGTAWAPTNSPAPAEISICEFLTSETVANRAAGYVTFVVPATMNGKTITKAIARGYSGSGTVTVGINKNASSITTISSVSSASGVQSGTLSTTVATGDIITISTSAVSGSLSGLTVTISAQ